MQRKEFSRQNFFGICLIVALLFSGSAYAQVHGHDGLSDDHHVHSGFEIGTSAALVYHPGENNFSPGFHLHIQKNVSDRWGIGLGYEGIPSDEYHQTLTVFGAYALTPFLSVLAGPGLTFPDAEGDEYRFTGHLEINSAFELGKIHLGPFVGAGFSEHHTHYSMGLHIGWHF
ncbi:MAG TPA: hypothetical protein PLK12_02495 [Prolixibacteraceae bacterium]|nr:hypothetical protein [Prolixibacteraceae bacterium]